MTRVEKDSPVWLEYQPEQARLGDGFGRLPGPLAPPADGLHCWVRDAGQKGAPPVRIDGQVRRWQVADDTIEVECAGGTIQATPNGESDPSRGMVSGRVTTTVDV